MTQPVSPDPFGSGASGAGRDRARLAAFLAGEWTPNDAAECAELVSAWHAQQAGGGHDLPSLLELTADLDALGLSDSLADDPPDWVRDFDVEAALERARDMHEAGNVAADAETRPIPWRPIALAAVAVAVALLGIQLGTQKDSKTGVEEPAIPVFGEQQLPGYLTIVAGPNGQRRLVAQDLPEELADVRRWLRVEVQAEEETQTWTEVYSGELEPEGYPIDADAGITRTTRLRWRGNIQVPGEIDARWSSGWHSSD